jgi:hypothetical protein
MIDGTAAVGVRITASSRALREIRYGRVNVSAG